MNLDASSVADFRAQAKLQKETFKPNLLLRKRASSCIPMGGLPDIRFGSEKERHNVGGEKARWGSFGGLVKDVAPFRLGSHKGTRDESSWHQASANADSFMASIELARFQ